MSVLIQISDPHFGTTVAPVVVALKELVRKQAPQTLVLSGDITQRARRWQFAAARRFVDELGIPQVLAVPGNHDIPLENVFARLLWPYAGYRRAFGEALETEISDPGLLVIGVNTTRPWRHIDGEISQTQVQRISERLRESASGQLRVVVVHQPVGVPHRRDEHDRVHGREAATRAWVAAGADLVMGGHIHLPYVLPLETFFAGLPRRAWCVQAGTATSHRVRPDAPNSVNIVRHGLADRPGCCEVERWDYAAQSARFERVERHELRLDRL